MSILVFTWYIISRLVGFGALEEISTQNGPPKKNNKIIVKIIK